MRHMPHEISPETGGHGEAGEFHPMPLGMAIAHELRMSCAWIAHGWER